MIQTPSCDFALCSAAHFSYSFFKAAPSPNKLQHPRARKIDEVMMLANKYRLFNGSVLVADNGKGHIQKRRRPGEYGMEHS